MRYDVSRAILLGLYIVYSIYYYLFYMEWELWQYSKQTAIV